MMMFALSSSGGNNSERTAGLLCIGTTIVTSGSNW